MSAGAVHWIARVLGALISVVAIDSEAQHRVFASASGAHTRKTTEVTSRAVHHVGIATLTIHWIAHVLGALVLIVTVDACTQHRVFARAASAHARKTAEVACHSIGHIRMAARPVHGIARILGAFVLIIAINAGAQHGTACSTRACGTRPSDSAGPTAAASRARAAGASRAAGPTAAARAAISAEWRGCTARVVAIKEPVCVIICAIFAVAWLGSFDASSSRITSTLAATAHAD
jgi:hypothetical protein